MQSLASYTNNKSETFDFHVKLCQVSYILTKKQVILSTNGLTSHLKKGNNS